MVTESGLEKGRAIYICTVFIIVLTVPWFTSEGTKPHIFQLAVCRDFYAAHDASVIDASRNVFKKLCRISDIQSTRARMCGVMARKEAIPGLVVAVPLQNRC